MVFTLILLMITIILIYGVYSLIKGYKNTINSEKDSNLYYEGKQQLKTGTNIFIVFTVILIIGFSVCFSFL